MEKLELPKYKVIKYVRKNRIPFGVLVACQIEDRVHVAFSLCHKGDRFNKKLALKLAFERAQSEVTNMTLPQPFWKEMEHFNKRCMSYFKPEITKFFSWVG